MSEAQSAIHNSRSSRIIHNARLLASTVVLILALVCLSATTVAAQTFRGTILGTVSDPQGAIVPGANVMAVNVGTGIMRSTLTDTDGNYTIAELPTGTYQIR